VSGSGAGRGKLDVIMRAVAVLVVALVLAGCGSAGRPAPAADRGLPAALVAQARPIGRAPAFHPPASGPVVGRCSDRLGKRSGVHVELFASNRVVLVAAGIGTRAPRTFSEGRISRAGCYGDLVTIEPTGVVLVRPGARLTLADLFRSWGQPLSPTRMASFTAPAGTHVAVFVGGRRRPGPPGRVPLAPHAEIVLEVGPYVPPHASYTFPPGA
jgi:hypothetical protein